jgi:hypothetical protein
MSFNGRRHISTQVALYSITLVNNAPDIDNFFIRQIVRFFAQGDPGLR